MNTYETFQHTHHLKMLIGVPCSGKSTWAARHRKEDYYILSSDTIIEEVGKIHGWSYNDAFKIIGSEADKMVKAIGQNLASNSFSKHVIWDQTNLTKKSRVGKLAYFGERWSKAAYYFETPSMEVLLDRNRRRPGKVIPENILNTMVTSLQPPTSDEGFDAIYYVRVDGTVDKVA